MQKEYVTIGTPTISRNIFRNVLRPMNNFNFKPCGGLWSSESSKYGISSWFDYLAEAEEKPYIYYIRDLSVATSFVLKDNANILNLTTYEDFLKIAKEYPSVHHSLIYIDKIDSTNVCIDYEKLSKIYDGIYINYYNINFSGKTSVFRDWSCNTLLLFNLDCIKEYKTLNIAYDIDKRGDYPVLVDVSEPKIIHKRASEYDELYHYINSMLNDFMSKNNSLQDYDKYLEELIRCSKKVLAITQNSKKEIIGRLRSIIQSEDILISDEEVLQNIVVNSFRDYLDNDEKRILTLKRSPVNNKKWYEL